MGRLSTARRLYRERGAQGLFHVVAQVLHSLTEDTIHDCFRRLYDVKGGTQTFTIEGVSATFDATSDRGGDTIRAQLAGENEMLADMLTHLRPDDVVFDVGANVGLYTVFSGMRCSEVHAFEPAPQNYEQLLRAAERTRASVECHPFALSDTAEEISFSGTDRAVGHGKGGLGAGEATVETVRGDAFVNEEGLPSPDVVKIDVEGAEGLVLDGMRETLRDCRRLYCEVHLPAPHRQSATDYGWTPMEFLASLSELGFDVDIRSVRGPELQVVCS